MVASSLLVALFACQRARPPEVAVAPEVVEPATERGLIRAEPGGEPSVAPLRRALTELGFSWPEGGRPVRAQEVDGETVLVRLDPSARTRGPELDGAFVVTLPATIAEETVAPIVVAVPVDGRDPLEHDGAFEVAEPGPYGLPVDLDNERRWMLQPGGRIVHWPDLDAVCDPGDDDACLDALAMVLSAERVALLQTTESVAGRTIECTVGLEDCLREALEVEHALELLGDVVVAVAEDGEDVSTWSLVRFAVRTPDGEPLPPRLVAEPPFTLVEQGRRTLTDGFSRTVLETTIGVTAASHDGDGIPFVVAPGERLTTVRPRTGATLVVCSDAVRRVEALEDLGTRVGISRFFDSTTYFLAHDYALPCDASLVVDPSVVGVEVGARGPALAAPPPHEVTDACPVVPDGVTSCTVPWSGDLNRDEVDDLILNRAGEMGCGEQTLSGPLFRACAPRFSERFDSLHHAAHARAFGALDHANIA
ncbi:MAG: hypothetical protein AAF602_21140, partial [Myxococcota bacterium]